MRERLTTLAFHAGRGGLGRVGLRAHTGTPQHGYMNTETNDPFQKITATPALYTGV